MVKFGFIAGIAFAAFIALATASGESYDQVDGFVGPVAELYHFEPAVRNPHFHSPVLTGNCNDGRLHLRMYDSPQYCLTTDCGHNAQDSLFTYRINNNKMKLVNVVDNPLNRTPAPYGVVRDERGSGTCEDDEMVFDIRFGVFITNTSTAPPELVSARNEATYTLRILPGKKLLGFAKGFSMPWSSRYSGARNTSNPYQALHTEVDIDTRLPNIPESTTAPYSDGVGIKNLLRAHRVVSPYDPAGRYGSPAPIYVDGEFEDLKASAHRGLYSANLTISAGAVDVSPTPLPGLNYFAVSNMAFNGFYTKRPGFRGGNFDHASSVGSHNGLGLFLRRAELQLD